MPGTNAGTGNPLTFRCSKCKTKDRSNRNRGTNWLATGERRESHAKRAGPRSDRRFVYGYRCLTCGYNGWSRHERVKAFFDRLAKT